MTDDNHSERDVVDLGHRPRLDPRSQPRAQVEPPKAELRADPKPPSVAEGGTPVSGSTLSEEELDRLSGDIVRALKTVYDPEIPADIYELGLIYKIDVDNDRSVEIEMTLTAPGCPVAGEMPQWVQAAVENVEGVRACKVNLVFEPPWDQSRMSDEARLAVGMF